MSIPFRPLGNRVVIKADVEDRAPAQTASGLITAKTLAAAVEGSDAEDSWFVGTIVAVGPLVGRFDLRPFVLKRLGDYNCRWSAADNVAAIASAIKHLPPDCPDPLQVGDCVTFSWASGQQITVDGDRFLIMAASDVLAVLDPDDVEVV